MSCCLCFCSDGCAFDVGVISDGGVASDVVAADAVDANWWWCFCCCCC